MIGIVTALHSEAAPLIELLGLKKDISFPVQPLFESAEVILIESGIGKVRSAIAVTRLIDRIRASKKSSSVNPDSSINAHVINIGCAALANSQAIGKLFLAHKITDHSTQRSFYPDILWKHGMEEASLESFDMPVSSVESLSDSSSLADMEASGFFEAASLFLSPDKISCLKVISDNFSPSSVSADSIDTIIRNNLSTIESYISACIDHINKTETLLTDEDIAVIEQICIKLNLTFNQKQKLYAQARSFAIKNSTSIEFLLNLISEESRLKTESKKVFSSMMSALTKKGASNV